MTPSNGNLWSNSRRESPECQQRLALRKKFLQTLLCSNDILNPGYTRKKFMRKRSSIPDGVCFNYEQLFHPVHCSAREKANVAQKLNALSKKVFVFSQL